MESTGRTRGGIFAALTFVFLHAGLAGGCGTGSPLAPTLPDSPPQYTAADPPPFLSETRSPSVLGRVSGVARDFVQVATRWVDPGLDKTVAGGRYAVRFLPASLSQGVQVVIRERDPSRIEFELGPHGTQFGDPVELTIDFAGTSADSTSGHYDGSVPVLYWFNDESGLWESVPGKVEGLQFHTTLEHFSTYGLARGKSGW